MKTYRNPLALILLCLAGCLVIGCNSSVEPEGTAPVSLGKKVANLKAVAKAFEEENANLPEENDKLAETLPKKQEYAPPFPDRVELFKAPKRNGQGAIATQTGAEGNVELIGFVNVDSQQVVLSIDGMITPMEEGAKFAEIEVISIQPPTVLLQRGRQRWQEALEN